MRFHSYESHTSNSIQDSNHSTALDNRATASESTARRALNHLQLAQYAHRQPQTYPNLPAPSPDRLSASLIESPLNASPLTSQDIAAAEEKGKTVLYLAYGSNLSKETFRGKRGIKPISQINVVVPELRLTFDLPGIPYSEPCFANTARRATPTATNAEQNGAIETSEGMEEGSIEGQDYHKDRWHKGLVGCVYEVTPSDYAHIIATEGGGASYHDILVTCYPLPAADTVPGSPITPPFMAHTLFAQDSESEETLRRRGEGGDVSAKDRFHRPDPSYAQPSARYLKLMTDGATELSLPAEYQAYLAQIRPYTVTSQKQQLGQFIFLTMWSPFLTLIFSLMAKYQDDKGRSPDWLVKLSGLIFLGVWVSYDDFFKDMFGNGERTQYHKGEGAGDTRAAWFWRRGKIDSTKGWEEHC